LTGLPERILVVEDEAHLAEGLRFNLEAEGYDVECVETGEEALERLGVPAPVYSLAILDVMLPGVDGFHVARELRARGHLVPVLMLTARGRSQDVLQGFEAGADDYLPKPFELGILLARLRALLRRSSWRKPVTPDIFEFHGRRIDFANLELTANGDTLRLTVMEAQLLRFLVRHKGSVVSRKAILEEVWGLHEETDTRAIDNFVVRLRRQIEDEPARPKHLLTVRGVGYRFEP
jgi:DNA-binding response OmpR family regulator